MERVTGIGGVFIRARDPDALSEYGRFGWARDAEGNRIELWQPAAGW